MDFTPITLCELQKRGNLLVFSVSLAGLKGGECFSVFNSSFQHELGP
jgi:hypothetical protein